MKKYSTQIYKIRKLEGLSQEEFGNKIGVSRQMVSRWEMGISSPRTDKINTICTAFGIKPEEFLSDDDEKEESKKITNIIHNNKKEKAAKEKELRRKAKQISILIISAIFTLYILCSIGKFIYLKSLNKKMLKFKGLNNYHFILTIYMEDKAVERKEVWYLDGKYKIEETYSSYEEQNKEQKSIFYIDINNNTGKEYVMENSEIKYKDIGITYDNKMYQEGNLLYNYFPTILHNYNKEIIVNSFKLGFFKTINSKDTKRIIINNNEITLDKETQIPIRQKVTSNKNIETSQIIFLKTKFNCVKDEDVRDIYEK